MSESKFPPLFTPEWWELRRNMASKIAESQSRAGIKWTPEKIAKSKRDEYFSLYGREAAGDELYAQTSHWQDR